VHPPGVIDAQLPKDKHLGQLDKNDITERKERPKTKDELRMEREQRNKPRLSKMHSLLDLEVRAYDYDTMNRD
jgi:L-lactate dehydrogenase (cytochrome)